MGLADEVTFTGRIEAKDKVQVRARVQGYLGQRHFEEGAEVEEGDLLFTIEPESFEIAVAQAEANLSNARAAETLAQQTFDRTNELTSRKVVSKADLDTAQANLSQAKATVQAREAELAEAKLNLGYTKISAPMAGRVGRAAYSAGNFISSSSDPLVTIVAQDPMYVTFPVPQRILLEVRKAGRGPESVYVQLRLSDGTIYDERGAIAFADVQATSSTDSVMVRATIANPKRLLVDQQLVDVQVVRKEPEQKLVISQAALLLDQQGAYTLVVGPEDKVVSKRIVTGEQRGSLLVVEQGLDAGDKVIVSGHQKAQPGAVVKPQLAERAGAAPAPQAGNQQ